MNTPSRNLPEENPLDWQDDLPQSVRDVWLEHVRALRQKAREQPGRLDTRGAGYERAVRLIRSEYGHIGQDELNRMARMANLHAQQEKRLQIGGIPGVEDDEFLSSMVEDQDMVLDGIKAVEGDEDNRWSEIEQAADSLAGLS